MAFRQTMKAGRKHAKKSRRASKRSRRASRKSRRGRKGGGGLNSDDSGCGTAYECVLSKHKFPF